MIDVLNRTGHKDAASEVNAMLQASKVHVRMARNRPGDVEHLSLSMDECNSQLLYLVLNEFEALLEIAVGAFQYEKKTFTFGQGLNKTHKFPGSEITHEEWESKWGGKIRSLATQFKIIVQARHWYFHHTGDDVDISKVLRAMREILAKLQTEGGEWRPPALVTSDTAQVKVTLEKLPGRMSIPIDRDQRLVPLSKHRREGRGGGGGGAQTTRVANTGERNRKKRMTGWKGKERMTR
jgi:hypothetical protein